MFRRRKILLELDGEVGIRKTPSGQYVLTYQNEQENAVLMIVPRDTSVAPQRHITIKVKGA